MSSPRNALGRGIGALIPNAGPAPTARVQPVPPEDAGSGGPARLPVDAIDPNPDQPRREFDEQALERLAQSIRVHGVLQPVVVRRAGARYELVVGERRWRASQRAGVEAIPAVVLEIDPRDRLEVALIENVQRRDLNPIELAVAFRSLADTGATQDEIGERVGLDRSSIANHLRLLELSREHQADVEAGRVSVGHAKALLQISSAQRRAQLRDRIVNEQLSVRAAEELARPSPKTPRDDGARRAAPDPHLQAVCDALRERLQTRVRVKGDGQRGRIELEYFGPDDFERLTGLLLGDA